MEHCAQGLVGFCFLALILSLGSRKVAGDWEERKKENKESRGKREDKEEKKNKMNN